MKLPYGIRLPRDGAELTALALSLVSMRWAALPVTDKRWAAPLAGIALAMGMIVGVAMGPSTPFGQAVATILQAAPGALGREDAIDGADGGLESSLPTLSSPGGNTAVSAGDNGLEPVREPPAAVAPAASGQPPAASPSAPKAEPEPFVPVDDGTDGIAASGTVVQLNPTAESFLFATDTAELLEVHASEDEIPEPTDALQISVTELANGTYRQDGAPSDYGENNHTDMAGIVTFRDPEARTYTVSDTGVSVLVHQPPEADPATLPELGDAVSANVSIEILTAEERRKTQKRQLQGPEAPEGEGPARPECGAPEEAPPIPAAKVVEAEVTVDEKATKEAAGIADLSAIVQGVCENAGELILSADSIRQSGRDLTAAAGNIDLTVLEPGDVVTTTVTIGDDGSYEVSGLSPDGDVDEANDSSLAQGAHNEGALD